MNTLSVTIMNAAFDAQRRSGVEAIIREIGPDWIARLCADFSIIMDFKKDGPWHTAQRCWVHGQSTGATHHLVLQDDIEVCDDFLLGVLECINAYPDNPISLYANRKICEAAREQDARWCRIPDGVWGQGIVMPVNQIQSFLEWQDRHIKKSFPHDDTRLAMWMVDQRLPAMCPQPSFIQHRGASRSIVGQSDKRKVARWFQKQTPLSLDWKNGAVIDGPNGLSRTYYDYFVE